MYKGQYDSNKDYPIFVDPDEPPILISRGAYDAYQRMKKGGYVKEIEKINVTSTMADEDACGDFKNIWDEIKKDE
jgi:hypothetical protein